MKTDDLERREVAAGRLPERYALPWRQPFLDRVTNALRPGAAVLDVGSGAAPAIPCELRPPGTHYVGLDASAHELQRAPRGSYDEVLVGDVCTDLPGLRCRFDLAVSWQVLEHVASMRAALRTQNASLVPGGRMVAMFSGAWAVHALASRALPSRVSDLLLQRLLHLAPENHFPTHYDACTARQMRRLLAEGGWSSWSVLPLYKSGMYLRFSPTLQRAYLCYENWAARKPRVNLATHYVVEARK